MNKLIQLADMSSSCRAEEEPARLISLFSLSVSPALILLPKHTAAKNIALATTDWQRIILLHTQKDLSFLKNMTHLFPTVSGISCLKPSRRKSGWMDGRPYDYRKIKITFGTDYGCCFVDLGRTRVMAQVSCELVAPKESRPNEGIMFFNIELSPMASPAFEQGRQSELSVKLNRQLERCLRNSKCIDTESLCVVSGEKVWQIRVDVHMLNHDGNLMDAASIAAITALCHFRRPDVAIQGDEVTVFSPEERDPIPLSIYHMPISVSFSFFQQGTYLLVDPCEREERVMDGLLMIAMNKHREICSIQSSGGIMLLKDQVMRCSKIASVKVSEITELIGKALENDKKARKAGGRCGFAESIPQERITALKMEESPVEMMDVTERANDIVQKAEAPPQT
ncbi:exosome complex component RRP45, partial [Lates japonicus]